MARKSALLFLAAAATCVGPAASCSHSYSTQDRWAGAENEPSSALPPHPQSAPGLPPLSPPPPVVVGKGLVAETEVRAGLGDFAGLGGGLGGRVEGAGLEEVDLGGAPFAALRLHNTASQSVRAGRQEHGGRREPGGRGLSGERGGSSTWAPPPGPVHTLSHDWLT